MSKKKTGRPAGKLGQKNVLKSGSKAKEYQLALENREAFQSSAGGGTDRKQFDDAPCGRL